MSVAPRLFTGEAMTLIGRRERYALANAHAQIPVQWGWFNPRIPEISARQGFDTFGLCIDSDDSALTYFCGVRVPPGPLVPTDLVALEVPALRYAGFAHEGPTETLTGTIVAALRTWLPAAGLSVFKGDGVPDLVEHYGPDFDPQTGRGGLDIWVPVGAS